MIPNWLSPHADTDEKFIPELNPSLNEVLHRYKIKTANIDSEGFELEIAPEYHQLKYTISFKFDECPTMKDFHDKIKDIEHGFDSEKMKTEMVKERDENGAINGIPYSVDRIVDYVNSVEKTLQNFYYGGGSDIWLASDEPLTASSDLDVTMKQRKFKIVPDSAQKAFDGGVDVQLVDDTRIRDFSSKSGYVRTFQDDIFYGVQMSHKPEFKAEFIGCESIPKTFEELLDLEEYKDAELEVSIRIYSKEEVLMYCELKSENLHGDAFVGGNILLSQKEAAAVYDEVKKQLGKGKLEELLNRKTPAMEM